MSKTLDNVEFETKYSLEEHSLVTFKQLLESVTDEKKFIYVEGSDKYFTFPEWWFKQNPQWDPNGTFARYRKPFYGLDNGRRQVTWKYKPAKSKNNISRIEHNWAIDDTPEDVIEKQLALTGMKFNFSIVKSCHVYKFSDAVLVFYTTYDMTDGKPKKSACFIGIEVLEENMHMLTEPEAFAIISKYEKLLAPLGITAQKRLKKSLFEMFVRREK